MLRIHRMLSGFVFGTICLVFLSGCWFNRTDWETRQALTHRVNKLFWHKHYDELERLCNELRTTKARWPGGTWKLSWIYEGFRPGYKSWPYDQCADWDGALERIEGWRAKYPDSLSLRMAEAWISVQLAWSCKQDMPIEQLDPERRRWFVDRAALAQRVLEETRASGRLCPDFFEIYLTLGNMLRWDQQHMDDLFAEAVAFEPDYYDCYIRRLEWYLPSYGGDNSKTWQSYINRYTSTLPTDDGALIYAYAVWTIADSYGYRITDPEISWPKLRHGLDVMEKRYPGSVRVHNAFCRFAFEVQDKATARRLFSVPDFKYDRDIWRNNRDLFRQAVEWAMSGPVENVVEEYNPEPSPVREVVTAVTEKAESPAPVETNALASGRGVDDASPEDWDKALAQVKTTGVMKQRGKYVAFVNGQIVRLGDIVPIQLGGRVFQFVVKEITARDCHFEPAGLAKGGTL